MVWVNFRFPPVCNHLHLIDTDSQSEMLVCTNTSNKTGAICWNRVFLPFRSTLYITLSFGRGSCCSVFHFLYCVLCAVIFLSHGVVSIFMTFEFPCGIFHFFLVRLWLTYVFVTIVWFFLWLRHRSLVTLGVKEGACGLLFFIIKRRFIIFLNFRWGHRNCFTRLEHFCISIMQNKCS